MAVTTILTTKTRVMPLVPTLCSTTFLSLDNIIWNFYDQLGRTAGHVQSSMDDFSKIFAFKKMNVIKDGDNFAAVEALAKGLIGQGVTITKDSTRDGTQLTSQNTLEGPYCDRARSAVTEADRTMFLEMPPAGKDNCVNEDLFTGFMCHGFTRLPAIKELERSKWGGVTEEDITTAAFNTWWYKNGQTNNPRSHEETDLSANGMLSNIIDMETRAPGLV
ncbi:hypothetical protein CEP54_015476 [Fusarium duplospermum]|uniref:Uncharacterized protein n=1 Tax=Fusarium duplospermum TaxID=1325734 RepID=A0A428NNU5_9HYPO|nr:hypothetical protein CEP54_015476 [Fusarium duplospermum]